MNRKAKLQIFKLQNEPRSFNITELFKLKAHLNQPQDFNIQN